jgi:hypothetical protein
MRVRPELQRAFVQAVRHLENNGAKYLDRGRAIHGGSRLTSWRASLEECCTLREMQYHLNLFCQELGCTTIILHTTSSVTDMADQGLIYGVLPLLPIE